MIKVYSTPTCSYCVTLKKYLKKHDIEFEDIDVAQDDKARDEMIEKSDQMSISVIDIDGEIIVGFNKKLIDSLLNLID